MNDPPICEKHAVPKRRIGPNTRGWRCHVCDREHKRRLYAARPEKHREAARRRYAANPEPYRRYAEANREKLCEDARRWRAANPEKVRENLRRIQERNQAVIDAEAARRGSACQYLGCEATIRLEWHHRDPTAKSFSIGDRYAVSLKRVADELAKCELVCRTHHRARHRELEDAA